MNINEIKDLMAQFDQSSLREFSYKNQQDELTFSKMKEELYLKRLMQVLFLHLHQ